MSPAGDSTFVAQDASVAPDVELAPGAVVHPGARVGAGSSIGSGAVIHAGTEIGEECVIEDGVFLGPGVLTTNDNTMGRHPRGEPLLGPVFKRACRVGGGAVILPGIVIGEEAFVAAGALVTRDVSDRDVVMGVPARVLRRVPDEDLIERWR